MASADGAMGKRKVSYLCSGAMGKRKVSLNFGHDDV